MKKPVIIFFATILIIAFTACGPNPGPVSTKNTANETEASSSENTASENPASAMIIKESTINFSEANEIKELEGKVFNKKTEVIDRDDFIKLIEQPKGYAKIYIGNSCGAMVTRANTLLVYSLYDIYYPTSKELADYISQGRYKIEYYELPGILSDDIFIDDCTNRIDSLWVDALDPATAGDTVSNGLIIDRKNALLLSFAISAEELLINKAIKLNEDMSEKHLKSVFSYKQKNDSIILLSDSKNNIYKIDALTLKNHNQDESEDLKTSKDWKIVGGIHSPPNMNGEDQYFIYMYNSKYNRFAKYDVLNKEYVYDIDLGSTQLRGEIVKVVSDGVGIYVLAKEYGKYMLFCTNENNWKKASKITRYRDGTEFGNIDDIWWFKLNEALDFIAVLDKNAGENPIKLTDLSQGQLLGAEQ